MADSPAEEQSSIEAAVQRRRQALQQGDLELFNYTTQVLSRDGHPDGPSFTVSTAYRDGLVHAALLHLVESSSLLSRAASIVGQAVNDLAEFHARRALAADRGTSSVGAGEVGRVASDLEPVSTTSAVGGEGRWSGRTQGVGQSEGDVRGGPGTSGVVAGHRGAGPSSSSSCGAERVQDVGESSVRAISDVSSSSQGSGGSGRDVGQSSSRNVARVRSAGSHSSRDTGTGQLGPTSLAGVQTAVPGPSVPTPAPSFQEVVLDVLRVCTSPDQLQSILRDTRVRLCAAIFIHTLFTATDDNDDVADKRQSLCSVVCKFLVSRKESEADYLLWMVFCAGWREEQSSRKLQWDLVYVMLAGQLREMTSGERAALLAQLARHRLMPCVYMSVLLTVRFKAWSIAEAAFQKDDFWKAYYFVRSIHAVISVSEYLQNAVLCHHRRVQLDWFLPFVGHEVVITNPLNQFRVSRRRSSRMLKELQDYCKRRRRLAGAHLLVAAARGKVKSVVRLVEGNSVWAVRYSCSILIRHEGINWARLIRMFQPCVRYPRIMGALLEGAISEGRRCGLASILVSRWMGLCCDDAITAKTLLYTGRTADDALFRRFVALDLLTMGGSWRDGWDTWLIVVIRHLCSSSPERARRARRMLEQSVTCGLSSLPCSLPIPRCLPAAVARGTLPLLKLLFHCGFFSPSHASELLMRMEESTPPSKPYPDVTLRNVRWLQTVRRQPRSLTKLSALALSRLLGCGPGRKEKLLLLGEVLRQRLADNLVGRVLGQLSFERDLQVFEEQWGL